MEPVDHSPWPGDYGQLQMGQGSLCVTVPTCIFLEGFSQVRKVCCGPEKAQSNTEKGGGKSWERSFIS